MLSVFPEPQGQQEAFTGGVEGEVAAMQIRGVRFVSPDHGQQGFPHVSLLLLGREGGVGQRPAADRQGALHILRQL